MGDSQPTTSPLTRVAKRRERTRRVLLEVALGLFYEKGIYWTKIEDITERADIGKGTFYQYFDTKEQLLAELLRLGLDQLFLRMQEGLPPGPGGRLIRSLVETRLSFFIDHPEYLLLLHQVRGLLQLQTDSSRELRDIYNTHLDKIGQLLAPILQGQGKTGRSARDLAVALAAFTSGLLTYHLVFTTIEGFKEQRAAITDQIERALLALI